MQGNSTQRYKTSVVDGEARGASKPWGTVVVVSIVFLIVYTLCLSALVLFVFCDYAALKSRVHTLEARIQALEEIPVAAEVRPPSLGDGKDGFHGGLTRSEAAADEVISSQTIRELEIDCSRVDVATLV